LTEQTINRGTGYPFPCSWPGGSHKIKNTRKAAKLIAHNIRLNFGIGNLKLPYAVKLYAEHMRDKPL
jgi:hypothetical protein